MRPALASIVERAIAAGHLPPAAGDGPVASTARPWPVVLMIALGAWLVALPLIGVFALALGEALTKGGAPYVIGPLVLIVSVVVLRIERVPLFVEQLAVPALLVGGGALCFGLFRDLHWKPASALLVVVALLLAALLRQDWLRVLLGALASQLAFVAIGTDRPLEQGWMLSDFVAVNSVLLVSLAAFAAQRICGERPGAWLAPAAWLEAVGCGWMLAVLLDLALSAGQSFLIGGALGTAGAAAEVLGELQRQGIGPPVFSWPQGLSTLFALAAAAWAAWLWPSLRRPPLLIAAGVLVLLSARLPTLGGTLLLWALTVTTCRWLRAGSAALAAAWIVGSFYYQLDWPLATKALALAGAGAALGLIAAWLRRANAVQGPAPIGLPSSRTAAIGIGLAVVATLTVINLGIARNERLIAEGRPVYIALRPVDPRSLMQGDFMRLNFGIDERLLPDDIRDARTGHPRVVLGLDARGIATVRRAEVPGQPLAADELLVRLNAKDGRWVIVTDGWFFEEGKAERFAAARFGEFRIDGDGRALLVGLADATLHPLR